MAQARQMKESEKKRFRQLTDHYGLTKDDFWFSPQGWAVISRNGIDRIATRMGLEISLWIEPDLCDISKNQVVIKAFTTLPDGRDLQTYGESNETNLKGGAKGYPVAMAEKRAISRLVLKASEFYQIAGVLGEDEASGAEQHVSGGEDGLQRLARTPAEGAQ